MTQDSKVKAFEMDLKGVDRRFNIRLFVLLAIMLSVAFLYERSSLKRGAGDIAFILILGGGILSLIIGIAKAKYRVCEKHGLVCPHCGSVPKAFYAISAMRTGICPRCKGTMDTQHAVAGYGSQARRT